MVDATARAAAPPAGTVPVRHWPGMRSEYAWVRPHPGGTDTATVTRPHQIGIAFTGHRRLAYESGGRSLTADLAPGSTIVSGSAPITWLRVHEITEALEIYPDPALVAATASASASRPVDVDLVLGRSDATVLGIGSLLRQAHVGGVVLSDVAASTLAHRLVTHLLVRYAGVRPSDGPRPGLLDARTVDRVADLVDARLHDVLTLDDLASAVSLSPFHFARGFARTTGVPPHRFVTSRRMDRARHLLWTSDRSVEDVARAVGYGNLSHFRRTFRRFHGVAPSALRS